MTEGPGLSAAAKLAPQNKTIETISIVFRPWRSANGQESSNASLTRDESSGGYN